MFTVSHYRPHIRLHARGHSHAFLTRILAKLSLPIARSRTLNVYNKITVGENDDTNNL